MMKHVLLSILLIAASVCAHGQRARDKYGIYEIALNKFVDELGTFYSKSSYINDLDTVFLFLADNFIVPPMIQGRRMVKLDKDIIDSVYASNGNRIVQVVVTALHVRLDEASVMFTVVETERIGGSKTAMPTSHAWTTVSFKLNCESKNWEHAKTSSRHFKE